MTEAEMLRQIAFAEQAIHGQDLVLGLVLGFSFGIVLCFIVCKALWYKG